MSSLVGGPEISPFGFPETALGAEVRVVCVPSMKSTLAWVKEGRELRNGDDGVNIQDIQGMLVLTIGKVTPRNSGNYTCTLKRLGFGKIRKTIYSISSNDLAFARRASDFRFRHSEVAKDSIQLAGEMPYCLQS